MTEHTLAGRLQELMGVRGVTQAALATRVGTSAGAVSNWLAGRKQPNTDNLRAIAQALGVPLSTLLEGADVPRDTSQEREAYRSSLEWYWRGTPLDEGRELGNAAAFAFDPTIRTLGRETGQNAIDERLLGETVWLDYSVIELVDDELASFLEGIRFHEVRPHLEAAASGRQKVGKVISAGLRRLDEDQRLVLLRISDFHSNGLTGPEYGRGRFTAVCRNTLDSQKGERAGGSYGLGKATMWAASAFGLVLTNSDLSVPEGGISGNRFFGRLELPWHECGGNGFAGPAWYGVLDGEKGCTRSYAGNATLAEDLYVERSGPASGTSFLVVAAFDPSGNVETVDEIAAELRRAAAENFWAAMVDETDAPPKLRVTVRTARGRKQLSEHVVDASDYVMPLVSALRKYRDGEIVEQLEQPGDLVVRRVTLRVPERIEEPHHAALDHDVLVLICQADDGEELETNRVQYLRGNSMVIRAPRLPTLPLGAKSFHAIVLAGEAAGSEASDVHAERFLRAAEPPAHNDWTSTSDVAAAYRRGGPAALARMEGEIRNVIREAIRGARPDDEDGPDSLKQLLRLVPPTPDNPKRPRVKAVSGQVDIEGAWEIEAVVTIPPRSGKWRFSPILQFATESGPGIPVKWASLTAADGCEIDGRYVITEEGARTAQFRGRSDTATHPIAASRARATLDIREARVEEEAS